MKGPSRAVLLAVGLLAAACATGPADPSGDGRAGFLSESSLSALAAAVPASPTAGSTEALADVAASQRMRALEDTDRWTLATRHAALAPAVAVSHFDCVVGARLTPEDAPALVALLQRVLADADAASELAKARAFQPRPVAVDPARRSCQVVSAASRASASYPSGSATVGAAYGEAFAALAPDREEAAREMGRQIGISRVVCGMHYPSDVEAGQALGRAVFEAERTSPTFDTALRAARVDLDRARAEGLTGPACAAERRALAMPLP